MHVLRRIALSLALDSEGEGVVRGENGLPVAIRLFRAGENETTKGVFLFDEKAADMVMAAAAAYGNDLAIDLEHLALDQESRAYDPDARGWFQLAVKNGELWAVNIRWAPDGARRLSERTQRYISPACSVDEDNRVTEIVNIALVAMPATHGTPALVAANRSRKTMTKKFEILARFQSRLAAIRKLADDAGAAPDESAKGKAAACKEACAKCAEDCDAAAKALDGGDMDAALAAIDACMKSMDACEQACKSLVGGSAPSEAAEGDPAAMADKPNDAEKMARLKAELADYRRREQEREEAEKVAKLTAEMKETADIVARLGTRVPPFMAKRLGKMPLTELRELDKEVSSSDLLRRVAPPEGKGEPMITGGESPIVSETEIAFVKARHAQLSIDGHKLRSVEQTIPRYEQAKRRQLLGAEEKGDDTRAAQLAKPLSSKVVKLARDAGLVALASTPVQPLEEFGASSQIALQSFRLEYNIALASMPAAWAETVGKMLSDGAMKVTFPISYDATEYQEKTAQNAPANQPLSFDIEVKQREFFAAKQIELRRLVKGDFAYVQRWAESAGEMARARIFLRNRLVTALLEAGTSGVWGVTSNQPNGIDGQSFFSATHKINPADASRQLRTSSTFSNYQASASPLSAATLTAEKGQALQVAAPDGRELGIVYDGVLYPSFLEQTAYNLLKVQDLILDAKASQTAIQGGAAVANAYGQVRNPHFNSGLEMTRAMDLAGTDNTANWYLYSREGIARGLPPWFICEDPSEEIRLWDENSDFYKNKGEIKIESHVFLNAALAFPHCIRLVKGS